MEKKRGRPPKISNRVENLQIRVNEAEKQAFADAAELAGMSLSAWLRDRMRRLARQELEEAGRPVPFLPRQE